MKPVAAFFLACLMLLGSLIPQNDLAELGKLPQLLRHYRFHHSAAGGGLSLSAFLAEHYGAGTRHQGGCFFRTPPDQDHHSLPLHHHDNCPVVKFVLAGARPALPPAAPPTWVARRYRPAAPAPCPDGPSAGLLQPPRA